MVQPNLIRMHSSIHKTAPLSLQYDFEQTIGPLDNLQHPAENPRYKTLFSSSTSSMVASEVWSQSTHYPDIPLVLEHLSWIWILERFFTHAPLQLQFTCTQSGGHNVVAGGQVPLFLMNTLVLLTLSTSCSAMVPSKQLTITSWIRSGSNSKCEGGNGGWGLREWFGLAKERLIHQNKDNWILAIFNLLKAVKVLKRNWQILWLNPREALLHGQHHKVIYKRKKWMLLEVQVSDM